MPKLFTRETLNNFNEQSNHVNHVPAGQTQFNVNMWLGEEREILHPVPLGLFTTNGKIREKVFLV